VRPPDYRTAEARALTRKVGERHFFSRARQGRWHKGATWGDTQVRKACRYDCDGEALLALVEPRAPAGESGVPFFALSGFLITSLLLREFDRTSGVSVREFYRRRVARLIPALAVLLPVTTGALLRGVRYDKDSVVTHSIVMRSRSGTVRRIAARHDRAKLRTLTGVRYG